MYGARKIWRQLHREGIEVARCTVERLMRELGIVGVVRGRRHATTLADPANPVPQDLLRRDFTASAPNTRWVADLTEVATWSGKACCAFVIDCFSRFIVGWRLCDHMPTDLPLDALEMALWQRHIHKGQTVHHSDHGSQYLSIRYTTTLSAAEVNCSAGTVGDSYDKRPRRDGDRPVQGGVGAPARPVADSRTAGAGHIRVGRLVQPAQASLLVRPHPTSRVRSHLLQSRPASRRGRWNAEILASIKPGAPQRAALAEPGFAQLFQRFGRQLNYRGRANVNTEIKLLGGA